MRTALFYLLALASNIVVVRAQHETIIEYKQVWSTTAADWVNEYASEKYYNSLNLLDSSLSLNFNSVSGQYDQPTLRALYLYDVSSLLQSVVNQYYEGSWINNSKQLYTYDVTGNVSEQLNQIWKQNNWRNFSKTSNAYDANDYILSSLIENWDTLALQWNSTMLKNYYNNVNGFPDSVVTQVWDKINSQWKNAQRVTYSYLPNGKKGEELLAIWFGTSYSNFNKSTYLYDVDDNLFQSHYFTWNFMSSAFDSNSRKTYHYTNNFCDTIVEEIYTSGNWANKVRSLFVRITSTPTLVKSFSGKNACSQLFPTLTSDLVELHQINSDSHLTYYIYDLSGRELCSGVFTGHTNISLAKYPPGLYYVFVKSADFLDFHKVQLIDN